MGSLFFFSQPVPTIMDSFAPEVTVESLLLRRKLLKYLRIYQIKGIPPKVLERAHLESIRK